MTVTSTRHQKLVAEVVRLQSQRSPTCNRPKSHDFGYAFGSLDSCLRGRLSVVRRRRTVLSIAFCGAFFTLAMVTGCSESESTPTVERMVYIDTATDEPLVYSIHAEWPVAHPQTGQLTLVPAMHCAQCQKWRALPPMDVVQRSPGARKCPVCGTELVADGPWPESNAEAN